MEQWETYYQGGALATGPTGSDGRYDLEVHQAWVEFFSTLPDGARLLDIGTGNGVVPLIAKDVAAQRGRRFEIHAADLAQIDPRRHVADGERRFAGIVFHPGVATERLPFDDASFDAVSGHYALEYSVTSKALAQIRRVLKPGSDAQFIIHHTDSALVKSARGSMQEADLVLKQAKIYRKLHRLVTMDQVKPTITERVTGDLVAAIRQLKQALAENRNPGGARILSVALDAVQKLLAARRELPPAVAGREVDRAEEEMRAAWHRLNDLVSHARSPEQMQQIQDEAAAAGFTQIECMPQHHAGSNLVGWLMLMHRP